VNVTVQPGLLRGRVRVPPSKSLTHRALIAAALSGGGTVENPAENEDIAATRACLAALKTGGVFPCGESGSTMRFFMPLSLVFHDTAVFTGSPGLLKRPMDAYFGFWDAERRGDGYRLNGRLKPGRYALPGDVSSQFITGLLFALPLLDGESEIVLLSPLESKPYVDLTRQVLKAFGVSVRSEPEGYRIPGGQTYIPCRYTVEGDQSAAAFWRLANALGSEVTCEGLNPQSVQGDRVMEDFARGQARVFDVRACPDLVPALAVMCALRPGEHRITGAGRLRIKECDRLRAVTTELNAIGGRVTELPDGLAIQGQSQLAGGGADCHNDHRIAMALAVAATRCAAPVTLRGAECVAKSYPAFFGDFAALGGKTL